MEVIDIGRHLAQLDHALLADLVGDARLVELLAAVGPRDSDGMARGALILDAVGGLDGLLEDAEKRRVLFLSLDPERSERLRHYLEVKDLFSMRLRRSERERLYSAFGGVAASGKDQAEPGVLVSVATVEYGLFEHQTDALLRASVHLNRIRGRVMLHMPTGAGKTRTAMHLISRHLNSRGKALVVWLVSGTELCEQAAEEFQSAWRRLGERPVPLVRLWGGHTSVDADKFQAEESSQRSIPVDDFATERWPMDLKDGVIVASLETMVGLVANWQPTDALARASNVSLVVFDEAHRAVAPSYQRILSVVASDAALLGLSATPGRRHYGGGDDPDAALADLFEGNKVILRIPPFKSPMEGLIEMGYLSRIEREELRVATDAMDPNQLRAIRSRLSQNLDLNEETLVSFGLSATRNLQILDKVEEIVRERELTRVILFAPSVFASGLLANLLRSRGIWAESITSKTPSGFREETLATYRSTTSDPKVLCNYGVLTTGFDAPGTSAVVIARPTASIVLLSQMAGRATRGPLVGGTKDALLVTVVDTAIPELSDVVRQFHAFDSAWLSADLLETQSGRE